MNARVSYFITYDLPERIGALTGQSWEDWARSCFIAGAVALGLGVATLLHVAW